MKLLKATLAAATMLGATVAAVPAAAQVNGIATSNPQVVILQSQARQTAYQQIRQTYATQIQQANTVQQEINTLQQSLDTNSDNQLTEAEIQANPNVVAQIQQKEQQAQQILQPIALAETFVIEQLLADYDNAQSQVIQQKGIQLLLTPDVVQFAPESASVTSDIVAALNQRMPTVQSTPPQGWQPTREGFAVRQQIQQLMVGIAQQQQAMAAQQQQSGQPQAPAQPSGR